MPQGSQYASVTQHCEYARICFDTVLDISRSSHQRCSMKKGVLRNSTKFTGKHLCQRLFFNKVAGLRPATLLKKSLWHRCFPVNFVEFLRTPFLQNTSGRLLLYISSSKYARILNMQELHRVLNMPQYD